MCTYKGPLLSIRRTRDRQPRRAQRWTSPITPGCRLRRRRRSRPAAVVVPFTTARRRAERRHSRRPRSGGRLFTRRSDKMSEPQMLTPNDIDQIAERTYFHVVVIVCFEGICCLRATRVVSAHEKLTKTMDHNCRPCGSVPHADNGCRLHWSSTREKGGGASRSFDEGRRILFRQSGTRGWDPSCSTSPEQEARPSTDDGPPCSMTTALTPEV